jgi:hypothetical protein
MAAEVGQAVVVVPLFIVIEHGAIAEEDASGTEPLSATAAACAGGLPGGAGGAGGAGKGKGKGTGKGNGRALGIGKGRSMGRGTGRVTGKPRRGILTGADGGAGGAGGLEGGAGAPAGGAGGVGGAGGLEGGAGAPAGGEGGVGGETGAGGAGGLEGGAGAPAGGAGGAGGETGGETGADGGVGGLGGVGGAGGPAIAATVGAGEDVDDKSVDDGEPVEVVSSAEAIAATGRTPTIDWMGRGTGNGRGGTGNGRGGTGKGRGTGRALGSPATRTLDTRAAASWIFESLSGLAAISDAEVEEGSPKRASIRGFNAAGRIDSKRPDKSRLPIGQKTIGKSIEDAKDEKRLTQSHRGFSWGREIRGCA